ncbi:MAG: 4-alpha-glucanotransferase [Clostridia bacterium]|nr:4-alpha-glucanotransferase [Clostridia bacterium]
MRTSGILMPVFSLPSKYGIGTLGREAYRFVDFLEKSGQTYWQMLPVGPTGFGDSPYQSFSVFAGNPYFIDLDMLCEEGYLTRAELDAVDFGKKENAVDYGLQYEKRFPILQTAAMRFSKKEPLDYAVFCRFHADWLDDYALFMAIKDSLNGCSLDHWPDELRFRRTDALNQAKADLKESIDFYKFVQYFFHRQWTALKKYANQKGILLFGDLPIYTSGDSADVWAHPELFQLDENLNPVAVAGCPPDAFSDEGQLWGNPLYNWDKMQQDGYRWWTDRMHHCIKLFDLVRIDHFRAFSAYYSIPFGDKNAVGGKWIKGPGMDLFRAMTDRLGKLPVIAEDLGTLDEDVYELLAQTGFPGMKVLQFAFDPQGDSAYLPHNIQPHCVVYTGTHDNDTAVGFAKDGPAEAVNYAREYLRIQATDSFNWGMISAAMATPAEIAILQMQDFLGLDNSARTNTPSVAGGNWQWRIDYSCINDWLAQLIRRTTEVYRRLPKK